MLPASEGEHAATDVALARLQHWLSFGPAIVSDGPHAGAVAGRIAADGRPEYAYPEIAGYFLTWLAFLARTGSLQEPARRLAPAIGAWHARWLDASGDTRVRLRPGDEDDWRNRAVFLFDLAMLLRGVAQASDRGLMDPASAEPLARNLAKTLMGLRDDQGFLRCMRLRNGAVPDRWSTRRGPFLIKALAAVLLAGRLIRLPAELVDAACLTLSELWPGCGVEVHPDSAHAALYFVEGVLLGNGCCIPDHAIAHAASVMDCVDPWRQEAGTTEAAPGYRHDVLAQWLRASLLLSGGGQAGKTTGRHDAIARRLTDAVREDGSLAFGSGAMDARANTWCALFAHQALWLYRNSREQSLPAFPRECLI